MNREQILNAIKNLAMSQGFYGRLLETIYSVDEDERDNFLNDLEEQNFRDVVDMVIYLES